MKNTLKITSGQYRGRTIATPGDGTHPMGERERLALFNMISGNLPGAKVLDAFAGSGALGIEAMSRGAASVVFVEKNRRAAEVVRNNIRELGLENAKVICSDAGNFQSADLFDVILIDPPYDKFTEVNFLRLSDFLSDDGILVLSHPGVAPTFDGLSLQKTRRYAGASISIYTR